MALCTVMKSKSDRDSLRRLRGQVAIYGRVLDRASLVVGRRLASNAIDAVPAWWEVLVAERFTGGVRLRRVRTGRRNPRRDGRALVELLWLEDALTLLAARNAIRGYRGRPRREVWDKVCALYDVDEIASAVRRVSEPGQRSNLFHCARDVMNGSEAAPGLG